MCVRDREKKKKGKIQSKRSIQHLTCFQFSLYGNAVSDLSKQFT